MKPKSYFQSATIITTNGYSSDSTSPSPPHSPRRNRLRTYRHCRHVRRSNKFDRNTLFSTVVFRQCLRYWLVIPLFYILGLIMCSCPLSFIIGPVIPGSVYRSHEIFLKVWPDIQKDNVTAKIELQDVWRNKKAKVKEEKPCPSVAARKLNEAVGGNGYLIIEANGGLNQQRSSICNAVALAGLMNATLVIPWFEYNSVWRDPSKFGDIYDEDHFIETLEGLVKVIRRVPAALMEQYDHNISNLPTIRVPAWAPISYYLKEVYPSIQNQGVIRLAPFANRLAMNIPLNLQYLRCLANYKALRFASSISTLAKNLVKQMMQKSLHTDGKYVSVHLRFEEDMVAFSCCTYDGGWMEKHIMNSIREKAWRGKFRHQDRKIDPGLNRISGKCPLTPVEVGMMLRGMGFDNNTAIYLASGRLYQSERHLAPLLQMFPLLYTKDSLAMPEELAPFQGYSSRLAALDYAVCLFSEVFVTTQGGNFPHFLMGHRRLLYGGHAKTVKPDKIKLVHLFHNKSISWNVMKKEMKSMLVKSNREGQAVPKDRKSRRHASIYKYPFPECRCLWGDQNITLKRINVDGLLDQEFMSVL